MSACFSLTDLLDDLTPNVAQEEIDALLACALVGTVVEATIRVRALTEIAGSSTSQLCATAAALEQLGRR